jgi:hypothetical protein
VWGGGEIFSYTNMSIKKTHLGDSFKFSKTEKGGKPTAAMLLIKVNYKLQMKWKRANSK